MGKKTHYISETSFFSFSFFLPRLSWYVVNITIYYNSKVLSKILVLYLVRIMNIDFFRFT